MRRVIVLVTLAGVAVLPVAALAASTGKTHHYTDHLVGALVQQHGKISVYAYRVTSSDVGPGASVSVDSATGSKTGAIRATSYFSNGSVRTAGSFRLGAGTASGLVAVATSGKVTGGTGAFKGAHGTFRGTGTYNPKTNMTTLTVHGVITP